MTAMPVDTVWTIKALLTWTTKHFAELGLESPRLDAELLLAHALDCKRIDLLVRYDEEPTPDQRKQFRTLVEGRKKHTPTAYLIGRREFYLLPFTVTPAVLIPRPDTEALVQAAIDFLKGRPTPQVLDLGTGSGCVAVAVAHNAKAATLTAVDVSPEAAAVARANAVANGVADRLTVVVGDLFAPLPPDARYDLILSNPPYIPPADIETLAPEVRDHEPRLALDGGPDGLAFYRRIVTEGVDRLTPDGCVMVEIGHTQEAAVRQLFDVGSGWTVGPTIKDRAGRPRVVTARGG
jgi:release factor glutamine methyltransferase